MYAVIYIYNTYIKEIWKLNGSDLLIKVKILN